MLPAFSGLVGEVRAPRLTPPRHAHTLSTHRSGHPIECSAGVNVEIIRSQHHEAPPSCLEFFATSQILLPLIFASRVMTSVVLDSELHLLVGEVDSSQDDAAIIANREVDLRLRKACEDQQQPGSRFVG